MLRASLVCGAGHLCQEATTAPKPPLVGAHRQEPVSTASPAPASTLAAPMAVQALAVEYGGLRMGCVHAARVKVDSVHMNAQKRRRWAT